MKRTLFAFITLLIISSGLFAQSMKKSPEYDLKKNVVRWNITPFLLWGNKNLEFGYERVITPNQSISLNLGYREFPKIINLNLERLNIDTHDNRMGYSIVLDYRRYLKKRNTKTAPDGLYVGPYIGSYNYSFENHAYTMENGIVTGDLTINGKINVLNFGIQLGYQFVISNWVAIDLILIGPGVGFYSGELTLDSDLSIDEQNEYLQIIKDIIVDKYPGMDNLLKDKNFSTNGVYSTWTAGFRYVIQIGILI